MSHAIDIIKSLEENWRVINDYLAGTKFSLEDLRRVIVTMRETLSKFVDMILSSNLSSELQSAARSFVQDFEKELADIASFIELCAYIRPYMGKNEEQLDNIVRYFINSRIPFILPSVRFPFYKIIAKLIDSQLNYSRPPET